MAQRAKEICSNFSIVKAFAFYVQFLTCRVIGKKKHGIYRHNSTQLDHSSVPPINPICVTGWTGIMAKSNNNPLFRRTTK